LKAPARREEGMTWQASDFPTLALSRSGGTGISQPSQRRAPRVMRLNLFTFCQLRGSDLLMQACLSGYLFFTLYPTLYLSLYPMQRMKKELFYPHHTEIKSIDYLN
jgi:hypothetical protein